MKISELENAPQWLKDAKVKNENVAIIDGIVVWHDGDWYRGDWRGGDWYGGDWRGGDWRGGIWYGGDWHGGGDNGMRCKWKVTINGMKIRIGCKEKAIHEWDEFFASEEEYETKRGTEAFRLIERAYRAVRAATIFDLDNPVIREKEVERE